MNERSAQRVLEVHGLSVRIEAPRGGFAVVENVSLSIDRGEILGIVGESGSGKSMLARSIMGLLPPAARVAHGDVALCGRTLSTLGDAELCRVRGRDASMVFQDPMTSLNPVLRIGQQLVEAIRLHRDLSTRQALAEAGSLLERVGLREPGRQLRRYPHELSGGMRQRALIAMAVANRPRLLIADEPTTALDVTVQQQILRLIRDLARDFSTAVLFITHNMGVVASLCDRVAVMYAGRIVEQGPVDEIFRAPRHPYTWALLNSVPQLDRPRGRRLTAIPGQGPDPASPPPGCRFEPRCRFAEDRCRRGEPADEPVGAGHAVRCWVQPPMPVAEATA